MADKYTSKMALILDEQVASVGDVIEAAGNNGDVDRAMKVGDRDEAMEVHWAGRMEKGVVRRLTDEDGAHLLRTETYVGRLGLREGISHQAKLLQALSRQLRGHVIGIRDLEARVDQDEAWVNRLAIGQVDQKDAVAVAAAGEGVMWVHSHGAARFDIPDIELYGLSAAQIPGAKAAVTNIVAQLLRVGLKGQLTLPNGTGVYLVPVLDAWQQMNLDWPGIGRAGKQRGSGLDGPRATLSVLHPPKLGRYRKDFKGVLAAL
ncbi:MAG: hypothetical protein ACI867_002410 [Glaciecola sp.]|jgi:hypothetical protein